mmetsp:Transcript_12857/g.30241  ORF Transcript_12857/g.30241 Transcript_12857/m.30241 type:complete len:270 (+) Transcript_12857:623-1432(+)
MRALPCPNCGPQRANSGLLGEVSDDELAGSKTGSMLPTRLDDGGGEEWRCATCKHVLSEQAMDREVSVPGDWPLVSSADAYGSSLLGWERRIESAAHNLLLHVYAGASGGAVNATLPRMPAILGALRKRGSAWPAPPLARGPARQVRTYRRRPAQLAVRPRRGGSDTALRGCTGACRPSVQGRAWPGRPSLCSLAGRAACALARACARARAARPGARLRPAWCGRGGGAAAPAQRAGARPGAIFGRRPQLYFCQMTDSLGSGRSYRVHI